MQKNRFNFLKKILVGAGLGGLLGFGVASQTPAFKKQYEQKKQVSQVVVDTVFDGKGSVGKRLRTRYDNGELHIGKVELIKMTAKKFKPDLSKNAIKRGKKGFLVGASIGALIGSKFALKKRRR